LGTELLKYENKINTVFTLTRVAGTVEIFAEKKTMLTSGHH
jgi:hypothetical protein